MVNVQDYEQKIYLNQIDQGRVINKKLKNMMNKHRVLKRVPIYMLLDSSYVINDRSVISVNI